MNWLMNWLKPQKADIPILDPKAFMDKYAQEKGILIDVRTPQEYNAGKIKNAKNINFMSLNFKQEIEKLDKNQPIFVYCRSGKRSHNAAQKMHKLGFSKVYDLQGGIINYQKHMS